MVNWRLVFATSIVATAVWSFTLGVVHARRADALAQTRFHDEIEELRAEMGMQLGRARKGDAVLPAGTTGMTKDAAAEAGARAKIVAEIKQQLQSEMGLLPVHLLRDRRMSFVELYSSDSLGNTNYGTAGRASRRVRRRRTEPAR
jgi:hypothetical protein